MFILKYIPFLFLLFFSYPAQADNVWSRTFPETNLNCEALCYGTHGMSLSAPANKLVLATSTLKRIKLYIGASTYAGYTPTTTEFKLILQKNGFPVDCGTQSGKTASDYVPITGVVTTVKEVEFEMFGSQCQITPNDTYTFLNSQGPNAAATWYKGRVFSHASTIITDGFFSAFPDITNSYQTRFLSTTATGTNQSLNFNVTYFLNLLEFSSYNRPDTIFIDVYNSANDRVADKKQLILPLTQGNSTSTIQLLKSLNFVSNSNLQDGVYSYLITFWSFNNNNFTFKETNIKGVFIINANNIISNTVAQVSNGLSLLQDKSLFTYQDCSLSSFTGCLINAGAFLLVPSPNSFKRITDLFSKDTFPFVNNVYKSYQALKSPINNPGSPDILSYHLQIPQANINVEMFSVSTIENLMGDTKTVFRNLSLLVLLIGFFTMIILTINRMLFFTEYITKN